MSLFLLVGGLSAADIGRRALESQIMGESVAVIRGQADSIDRIIYGTVAERRLKIFL